MTVVAHKETLDFQTEVRQLLNLMVHSLYSNKEIFLRELISNASDACDKLRFEALSDDGLYENNPELCIRVSFDKDKRTITVSDNGIGMSRNEVMDNLGTIAKSGTRQFLESLSGEQAKDAKLIGQFGVGFYSGFVVADKISVITRRAGLSSEHGVRWESGGEGSYAVETIDKAERGTEVTLHLRDGEDEFLDGFRLRNIIRKYSDHIALPILMKKDDTDEDETVNRASALWSRPKKEITEQEYQEFYKHIAHDFEEPLVYIHSQVEGRQSYTTLFYVPQRAPFDLWDRQQRHGIKLYVRRIFIMDTSEQLLPSYLRFVRGVVDSDDLPLNVSREILQHNRTVETIRAASVKKILGLLEDLAKNDQEKYGKFWQEFGRVLKEGPAEDFANRERIAALLRFSSTHSVSEEQNVSLDDYIGRMKEGQDKIFYITGETIAATQHSPHLEVFRKQGIEVLLLSDRIDEWLVSNLPEFSGKPLQSVAKGDLDLGKLEDQESAAEIQKAEEEYKGLLERMKNALGERVKEVRISHRLTQSPACLVVEEHDMGTSMRNLLKAAGHDIPKVVPILEINIGHNLVRRLNDEQDQQRFSDWASILFDQSLLAEGGQLDDPAAFVRRLNEMLLLLSH